MITPVFKTPGNSSPTPALLLLADAPDGLMVNACNSGAGATTFSIYYDPDGGTSGSTTVLADEIPIDGKSVIQFPIQAKLPAGGSIAVQTPGTMTFMIGELPAGAS